MTDSLNEYDGLDVVTKEWPGDDFRDLVTPQELADVGIKREQDIYQTVYLLAKRIKALEEKE